VPFKPEMVKAALATPTMIGQPDDPLTAQSAFSSVA
jgi:hypothetical protein